MNSLYRKPISLALVFTAVVFLAIYLLQDLQFGSTLDSAGSYSVITHHYGVNAEEIEQSITIPLENQIAELPGIKEIRSSSEFGQSRVLIRLHNGTDDSDFYLSLRDRVARAHAAFPQSAQKPQIVSSARSHRPLFIAAFSSQLIDTSKLRDIVEKEIKPELEKVPGTGEIEIGGGGLREIMIEIDQGRISGHGISTAAVASALQAQHIYLPVGMLKSFRLDYPITLAGRFHTLQDIKNLILPTSSGAGVPLGEIASVSYSYRYPETVSRVDGNLRVVAYIYGGGRANLIVLSQTIRKKIQSFRQQGYDIDIIYNQGEQMESSLREVAVAIGIGIIALSVFLSLLLPNIRLVLLLACEFPLVAGLSAAILTALGISVDRYILAGMAVGIGLIVDISLVISHTLLRDPDYPVRRLLSPLLASTLTTLVIFLPLYALESAAPGIRSISLAISVMLIVALVLNFIFLPPFIGGWFRDKQEIPRGSAGLKALYARILRSSLKHPHALLAVYGLVTAACCLVFVLAPKTLTFSGKDDFLFAQLEFPSGTNLATVDEQTGNFMRILNEAPFIKRIQSQARRGQAELTIQYEPSGITETRLFQYLKDKAVAVPRGFLFIDEAKADGTRLECALTGTDHGTLKTLTRHLVGELVSQDWVTDGVLHFKEDPPALIFQPDPDRLFNNRLTLTDVASAIRWAVQGPVALKWIEQGREMDLRVSAENNRFLTKQDLYTLPIPVAANPPLRAAQLGTFRTGVEPAKLYRLNRQNAIFFSITVTLKDIDVLIDRLGTSVDRVRLPLGYGFVLDQTLEETQRQFKYVWLLFFVAIFLVYVVISVQTESFTAPLLILSIVPLSIGVPAVLLVVLGYSLQLAVVVGCIILCGMVVNNSILIYDGYRTVKKQGQSNDHIIQALFGRLRPLLLTSGTTAVGSIPLLASAGGPEGFSGTLAFIIIFGVTFSVLSVLFFFPALLSVFPRSAK